MVLDPFPDGMSVLERRICEASTDAWRWVCVIRSIERMWAGATCEIRGQAHEGAQNVSLTAGRVTRDGFSLTDPSALGNDADPFDSAGRQPGEVFALAAADGGIAGVALVLHRCRIRQWVMVVSSPAVARRMAQSLQNWASTLIPAFRITHALATGDRPSKQDCDLIWDRLDHGAALCSADLRLLHPNIAAEEILSIRAAFRPGGRGRLRLHSDGGDERLEWAAARVLSGERKRERVLVRGALEMRHLAIGISAVRHSPLAPMVARSGAGDHLVLTLAIRHAPVPSFSPVRALAPAVEQASQFLAS